MHESSGCLTDIIESTIIMLLFFKPIRENLRGKNENSMLKNVLQMVFQ